MTYQKIVSELYNYYIQSGDDFNNWYVGITNDIDSRLHSDHNVSEEDDWYITAPADSDEIARQVESHFIGLGMDGGTGGGDSSSKYVYIYHKTSTTNP